MKGPTDGWGGGNLGGREVGGVIGSAVIGGARYAAKTGPIPMVAMLAANIADGREA